tara:strand:+ start:48 stop:419 length:372 start_codon:yes stop_codon:yes gene_type:complete
MKLIKIPKRFYDDHNERDLESPLIVKENTKNYWINSEDEHLEELHSDAYYYSIPYVDTHPSHYLWGVVVSARATLKAIEKAVPILGKPKGIMFADEVQPINVTPRTWTQVENLLKDVRKSKSK